MTKTEGSTEDCRERASATVPSTMRLGADVVRFRDYQTGDEPQIVELLRASFGGFYPAKKPVDEQDYIAWFCEPHGSHHGRIALAEVDSRIVSLAGELTRPIKLGGRTWWGTAGGIGAATHPDYQGRGIFRATKEWQDDTDDPPGELLIDTRTAGMESTRVNPVATPGRMGVYLYVQHPWRAARERRASLPVRDVLPALALALWGRLRGAFGQGAARRVSLRTVGRFDETFERFLEDASAAWDAIPVRSAEYLNWRFCDARAGRFIVRAAEAEGELLGYCVTHAVGARGHVMDLIALPDRLDVVRTLVTDALRQMGEAGTAAVECWMLRDHPYAGVLRRAGFLPLPGRSAQIGSEVGWAGPGIGEVERALLASPETDVHLVRADFDGI